MQRIRITSDLFHDLAKANVLQKKKPCQILIRSSKDLAMNLTRFCKSKCVAKKKMVLWDFDKMLKDVIQCESSTTLYKETMVCLYLNGNNI